MPIKHLTVAFTLSLIGGIFVLIGSVFSLLMIIIFTESNELLFSLLFMPTALIILICILGVMCGVLIIIGALMIKSGDPSRVRTGSSLVLAFSILSFSTGFVVIIGSVLALIGSIFGLVWKSTEHTRPLPPPPWE